MAIRKASSYSKKIVRPYTRKSAKKSQSFIRAVPQNKIVKFSMGDMNALLKGKHKYRVRMISEDKIQIRDNALEACRMSINKLLDTKMPGNYYFVVKVYPHHILRENKSAGGQAGADRLSHGMKHSFGVTMGRAAILVPGKEIFVITVPEEKMARDARDILAKMRTKVPCKTKILFEKL